MEQQARDVLGYGRHAVTTPLTDGELAEIARQHSAVGEEMDGLRAGRAALNSEINSCRAKRTRLDHQGASGTKERIVRVRYERGPAFNVLIVDDESGEQLGERAMSKAELQGTFEFAKEYDRGAVEKLCGAISSGDTPDDESLPLLRAAKEIIENKDKDAREAAGLELDPDVLKVARSWEAATKDRKRVLSAIDERLVELGEGPDETAEG